MREVTDEAAPGGVRQEPAGATDAERREAERRAAEERARAQGEKPSGEAKGGDGGGELSPEEERKKREAKSLDAKTTYEVIREQGESELDRAPSALAGSGLAAGL